jgi:hypothetical protein
MSEKRQRPHNIKPIGGDTVHVYREGDYKNLKDVSLPPGSTRRRKFLERVLDIGKKLF